MDNQVRQASLQEGKELAHLYDGAKDNKAVDNQVHDRLLQDAVKSHHSQLDLDVVRQSLVDESGKRGDKAVTISQDKYGQVRRDNTSLPLLNLVDGNKLYDPMEGYKAMAEDDKKCAEAEAAKKDGQTKLNLGDHTMGIATLFNQIIDATQKK